MTDITKEMIEAAKAAYWHEAHNGGGYSDKCYEAAISAALSSRVENIDINALAQEIRRVDGNHSLGAGALAEALAPFIAALSRPIDPKAEVEPVGYVEASTLKTLRKGNSGLFAMTATEAPSHRSGCTVPVYASPSIVAPVAVKPKPLEWSVFPEDGREMWEGQGEQRQYLFRAHPSVGGAYFIMRKDDLYSVTLSIEEIGGIYGAADEAKSVAQEHFDVAILSALTPAEKEGVAEDWNRRALSTTKPAQGDGVREAIAKVLTAEQSFREVMPADWEGDPLSEAITELRAALAAQGDDVQEGTR